MCRLQLHVLSIHLIVFKLFLPMICLGTVDLCAKLFGTVDDMRDRYVCLYQSTNYLTETNAVSCFSHFRLCEENIGRVKNM